MFANDSVNFAIQTKCGYEGREHFPAKRRRRSKTVLLAAIQFVSQDKQK
jgi:hypothetical protein